MWWCNMDMCVFFLMTPYFYRCILGIFTDIKMWCLGFLPLVKAGWTWADNCWRWVMYTWRFIIPFFLPLYMLKVFHDKTLNKVLCKCPSQHRSLSVPWLLPHEPLNVILKPFNTNYGKQIGHGVLEKRIRHGFVDIRETIFVLSHFVI